MKRVRLDQWANQLQPPRNPRIRLQLQRGQPAQQSCPFSHSTTSRSLSDLSSPKRKTSSRWRGQHGDAIPQRSPLTTYAALPEMGDSPSDLIATYTSSSSNKETKLNFPRHSRALTSARLSALHARLCLPSKLPLQTLARCLVDSSVDSRPGYNNAPLALLGSDFLGYTTSEYIICHFPRLPMPVLFAAQHAYVGPTTLNSLRQEWGVDIVAAPGGEVDPGLLQFERVTPGNALAPDGMSLLKDHRPDLGMSQGNFRKSSRPMRSMSSRIVYDDQFGDIHQDQPENKAPYDGAPMAERQDEFGNALEETAVPEDVGVTVTDASTSFVRALFGALYLHAGTQVAKDFHAAHILSRKLAMDKLFAFNWPTRDLKLLCAREGFEPPVARLISETGRLSRHPVFVVGVYSGNDKLGEGAGSSLDEARSRAAAAALRSWYLYSPPVEDVVLPSEVEGSKKTTKQWRAQLVDPGEIVC